MAAKAATMENTMPKGVYERQPAEPVSKALLDSAMPEVYGDLAPVKMVAMKLERHYRPAGAHEVVGYTKPAVTKKMPNGEMKIVEPEEYIVGEQCPPPFAGVISTGKIWASTTIKVPEDEAKTMKRLGIAERDFDD